MKSISRYMVVLYVFVLGWMAGSKISYHPFVWIIMSVLLAEFTYFGFIKPEKP